MRSFRNAAHAGFAALLLSAAVHAQPSDCELGTFGERLLNRYLLQSCWDKNKALQERVKGIETQFKRPDDPPASWIGRAREQLDLLLAEVQKREPKPVYAPLVQSLNEATAQLGILPDMSSLGARQTYRALQIDTWKADAPLDLPGGIATKYLTASGCSDKTAPDAKCAAVFQRAVDLGDDVFVAASVVGLLHEDRAKKFHEDAVLHEKRWHAYLYDTQFQYFWELGLNRWLEETCFDSFIFKCDKQKRDPKGTPIGPREPPTHRAILLHPDIGVQYIDAEPKGERFKPALVIQWFGYQWWDWKDNSDKISGLRGLSFASTISDNANYKALGWGAQIQINEYAVAFTSHSGKLGITLNLQLGDKISKLNTESADKLKKLKD